MTTDRNGTTRTVASATRAAPAGDFDYERNGRGYAALRRPDPRIAAHIHRALGDARTVLNVGAGAGSYEPDDRYVVAVEPSAAMRAQRPPDRVPAIDATAERLPFDDDSFDTVMATVTIHQWSDPDTGLQEMRRVSRGVVAILTFDAPALRDFWLYDYVPEVIEVEQQRFPAISRIVHTLGGSAEVISVPIPHDCTDGFGEAYYARPEDLPRRGRPRGDVRMDARGRRRGPSRRGQARCRPVLRRVGRALRCTEAATRTDRRRASDHRTPGSPIAEHAARPDSRTPGGPRSARHRMRPLAPQGYGRRSRFGSRSYRRSPGGTGGGDRSRRPSLRALFELSAHPDIVAHERGPATTAPFGVDVVSAWTDDFRSFAASTAA